MRNVLKCWKRFAVCLLVISSLSLMGPSQSTGVEKPLPDIHPFLMEVKSRLVEQYDDRQLLKNYTYRMRAG